jgi:phosphate acetyltransferase
VLVAAPDNDSAEEFEDRLGVSAETFGGIKTNALSVLS